MGNFIVSARKYRPQRFDEVVGQQHVTLTLKKAIEQNQLAHALLFCGPHGIGKTTCARILSKRLNCQNPTEDNEPCNTCTSCVNMSKNANFNIAELDAASHNSVDNMRSLIEQVNIPPQQGTNKVYIIDEVHMLSTAAFNAFLKTLEEPPSFVTFILATTEKHKIIPTILSRCQIYDFKRIKVKEIIDHLKYITEKEGIKADQDALHTIASKADGALRDALSIYDRVVSVADGELSYEHVIEQLNILDYDVYFSMTDALIAEDLSSAYLQFDKVLNDGFDPDICINGLMSHLRDLLVCQSPETIDLLEVSESLKKRYYKQAKAIDKSFLLTALQLCNACDVNYQFARNKRLHVEMALTRICYAGRMKKVDFNQMTRKSEPKKKRAKSKERVETSDLSEKAVSKNQSSGEEDEKKNVKSQEKKDAQSKVDNVLSAEQPHVAESNPSELEKKDQKANLSLKKPGFTSRGLGSLSKIKKNIKHKNEQLVKNKPQLNRENLEKFHLAFMETHNSPSTTALYKSLKYDIVDGMIHFKVAGEFDKNILLKEKVFHDRLRKYFKDSTLKIKILVDEKLKEEKLKNKEPNIEEKFKALEESNPQLKSLKDFFDLSLED